MIFLPAIDWLVVGGMGFAIIFVIIIAFLVNPPTALVERYHEKKKED